MLFLSIFLAGCTRPEDNALNKQDDIVPASSQPGKRVPRIYTITIENMKFDPEIITTHIGDTIIWLNKDIVAHCVTEKKNKEWTSSKIPNGGSWKFIVNANVDYYCAIHQVMNGKIVVE
jgi:plastocyanin